MYAYVYLLFAQSFFYCFLDNQWYYSAIVFGTASLRKGENE